MSATDESLTASTFRDQDVESDPDDDDDDGDTQNPWGEHNFRHIGIYKIVSWFISQQIWHLFSSLVHIDHPKATGKELESNLLDPK